MNIGNIKCLSLNSLNGNGQKWRFTFNEMPYIYYTYKGKFAPNGFTMIYVISNDVKLTSTRFDAFLLLDPQDPASGIERFCKLAMLK